MTTMMNNKIRVGMRSDARQNLQALAVFASAGMHAVFTAGQGMVTISLYKGSDLVKAADGPTYPVALRRLFDKTAEWKPDLLTEGGPNG